MRDPCPCSPGCVLHQGRCARSQDRAASVAAFCFGLAALLVAIAVAIGGAS